MLSLSKHRAGVFSNLPTGSGPAEGTPAAGLMPATRSQRAALGLLFVLAVWSFSFRLGAAPLLDDPNEGEYAEVAREMLESGDWISPQLNYVLFLNKPP